MAELVVDDVTLFHETLGTGSTILLLHGGLGTDHTYFRPDFDQLADEGTVVYLDQRGNGRSGRTEDSLTIEALADDAAAVIDATGGPATVIGHSYGGFVAQELAARHPDSVRALVLVSTTPGQLGAADDPHADQGPPPPPELAEAMASMPTTDAEYAAMMERILPFYVHGDVEPLRSRMGETIFDVRAMIEGFESLARWSVVDRLSSVTTPVLVLAGEHDVFTSLQQSERIARTLPSARLHVFRRSGHFPWVEEPDEFFTVLRAFLAEEAAS